MSEIPVLSVSCFPFLCLWCLFIETPQTISVRDGRKQAENRSPFATSPQALSLSPVSVVRPPPSTPSLANVLHRFALPHPRIRCQPSNPSFSGEKRQRHLPIFAIPLTNTQPFLSAQKLRPSFRTTSKHIRISNPTPRISSKDGDGTMRPGMLRRCRLGVI